MNQGLNVYAFGGGGRLARSTRQLPNGRGSGEPILRMKSCGEAGVGVLAYRTLRCELVSSASFIRS